MVTPSIPKPTFQPPPPIALVTSIATDSLESDLLVEDTLSNPAEGLEYVGGQWVEKSYMTLKHSSTQAKLAARWLIHSEIHLEQGQVLGGRVLTEALCQTATQKRRPDIAYVTDALLSQHGYPTCFPVSFPLVAEVASPDDPAEMLFAKAYEYLAAGTEEVWLLYPETRVAIAATADRWQIFTLADQIATQKVLPGFAIALTDLFS
jgi:Uma2 family endonuclease